MPIRNVERNDYPEDDEDRNLATGITTGVPIAIVLWIIILVTFYWLWELLLG
jgi:hypothetical protein